MAIPVSKKKSRLHGRSSSSSSEPEERTFLIVSIIAKLLHKVPLALLLLILLFLWSSSTTIISGNNVHVCVSSRKLNNLYCLSAGTQKPEFAIPIPPIKNSTTSVKQVVDDDDHGVILENQVDPLAKNGIEKTKNEEVAFALQIVEEHLRKHRSWASSLNQVTCNGRGIYVYELPPRFNRDLVGQCGDMIPWNTDFCKYFKTRLWESQFQSLEKGGTRPISTHWNPYSIPGF